MILDVNAWLGSFPFRMLPGDGSPAYLLGRMDRAGIAKACVSLFEGAFNRNVQPANERLIELIAPHADRLLPMATINPVYQGWERDLARCHEQLGMRGVRLIPQYHGYELKGAEGRRVAQACAERGLPIFIPGRLEDPRQRQWMDPGKVVTGEAVADLLTAVPAVSVVLMNVRGLGGSPLVTRPELRDRNWYVDLSLTEVHSGLFGHPELVRLIETAGARHVLFGSHMPLSYEASALVKRAVLPVSESELEQISYRTAAGLLGLEG